MGGLRRLLNGQNNINFLVWWKRGAIVSVVLVVVGLGSLATRGLNLGVEFTGGVSVEVPVAGVTVDGARSALAGAGLGSARVQIITDASGGEVLRVQTTADDDVDEAQLRQVVASAGNVDASEASVTAVSASWGADVTRQALRALVFFLLAIVVYLTLRLEFRMAIGALVATVHDLVITVGLYSIFQFEVTPGTIVAFLMVLGFSLYDTVVIYDKVKEGEPMVGITNRMTYAQGVSRSTNLVLLRSLNTSITSLLPVLSLLFIGSFVLGAVTLQQFTVPLAIGLVVGTYSSIMVAAPVVVWLKEREPRYRQLRDRLTGPGAGTAPPDRSEAPQAGAPGAASPASQDRPATARPTPSGAIPPRPRKRSGGSKRR
jgi:preprotein translocase subunit SecF